MYVLLGNLDFKLKEDHIRGIWRRYIGRQPDLRIVMREDKPHLWTGVMLARTSAELARKAAVKLNGQKVWGRPMLVWCSPEPDGEAWKPTRQQPKADSLPLPLVRGQEVLAAYQHEANLGMDDIIIDQGELKLAKGRYDDEPYDGMGFDPRLCHVCQMRPPIFRNACQRCMERPRVEVRTTPIGNCPVPRLQRWNTETWEMLYPWEMEKEIQELWKRPISTMQAMHHLQQSCRFYLREEERENLRNFGETQAEITRKRRMARRRIRYA